MRVWVTRDEPPTGPLSTALTRAGLIPVIEPVIQRILLTDADDEISKLGPNDWLMLTSVYAIEAIALEPARIPRTAVVGEASQRAALKRGLRVEMMSSKPDAATLLNELRHKITTGQICYPRSSLTPAPNPWPGVTIISPAVYETKSLPFDKSVIDRVNFVAVVSPSAVEVIAESLQTLEQSRPHPDAPRWDKGAIQNEPRVVDKPTIDGARAEHRKPKTSQKTNYPEADYPYNTSIWCDVPFASIGPITTKALRRLGIEPKVEADQRSFDTLAQAIADYAKVTGSR